jgi:hypothetical protein
MERLVMVLTVLLEVVAALTRQEVAQLDCCLADA